MSGRPEIIITVDGVKRRVPLPFRVCLDRRVARELADQLHRFAESDASYGWLTLYPPVEESGPDTKPQEWTV